MSVEANAVYAVGYKERSSEPTNSRGGYRSRRLGTRGGSSDLQLPKLLSGSYLPDWSLEPRRRAEQALAPVKARCFLVMVSTLRIEASSRRFGSRARRRLRCRR